MVYLLAGILSQTLSYPRFPHAFTGLMVILTSVGDAFPVYLRGWELDGILTQHQVSSYQAGSK